MWLSKSNSENRGTMPSSETASERHQEFRVTHVGFSALDLTVFRARGKVTLPHLQARLKEFLAQAPTSLVLWDFTLANLAEFFEEDVSSLFRDMAFLYERRGGGKTAMVFSRTVDFGVGRMSEVLSEVHEVPFQIQSFWDIESAREWLFSEGDLGYDKNLLSLVNPQAWEK